MQNVIFMGTPEFAAKILSSIIQNAEALNLNIVAVYTQADKPAGRGQKLQESEVKILAKKHGIPVCQPLNFKDEVETEQLAAFKPDILIVAAYGMILPQRILDIPVLGAYNVHASLLPQWRGAAPIHRAILAGDSMSGITIMRMEAGLDTGDILLQQAVALAHNETSATLHDVLADLGGKLIVTAIKQIIEERAAFISQNNEKATYAKKIQKEEYALNWDNSAELIERQVRAFLSMKTTLKTKHNDAMPVQILEGKVIPYISERPYITTGTILASHENIILIATGNSLTGYGISKIKPIGKKAMSAADFINGYL